MELRVSWCAWGRYGNDLPKKQLKVYERLTHCFIHFQADSLKAVESA